MKKLILTAALAAALALPSICDAKGFGGGGGFRGGGFSSSRSFSSGGFGRSSSYSYSRSYSSPRPSFGGSYAVKNNPTSSYSKNYPAAQSVTTGRTTVNNYHGTGNDGFFTGMMMGSMMNHPYYYGGAYGYGMGYPPYYMGGYGYNVIGGYGLNGYSAGGAYYPYSPVGIFFSWFFSLLSLFFVVYFTVVLLQLFWRFAMSDYID